MTSEDQKITLAAAMAMGAYRDPDECGPGDLRITDFGVLIVGANGRATEQWEPLVRPDQCFDVQVKLGITLHFSEERVTSQFAMPSDGGIAATVISIWFKDYPDRRQAAMRAVVHAASAIYEDGIPLYDDEQ